MLTDTQKAQIRLYLGYPDAYRFKNPRLESIMDNLSPDAETQIATQLANLATVEAAIINIGLATAGLKRVDEIWFDNTRSVLAAQRGLGRMYVTRVSIISGVPIYSDVFGPQGYFGDSFLPGNGEPTGGSFFNLA